MKTVYKVEGTITDEITRSSELLFEIMWGASIRSVGMRRFYKLFTLCRPAFALHVYSLLQININFLKSLKQGYFIGRYWGREKGEGVMSQNQTS